MAPQREWFEKDYYAVLGVPEGASEKDVTRAYKKLAKKHHPDANPGDREAEERFKEVSGAYDVIGDPEKRREYDEVRHMVAAGVGPGGARGGQRFGPGGVRFDFDTGGAGDLFGGIFRRGGRGRAPGAQRGHDLETELHLGFLDAVSGVTSAVRFTAEAACSSCGGSGARSGTSPEVCPECRCSGQVAVDQGPFSFEQVCMACGGRGRIVRDACPTCAGRGTEMRPREVKVRVPAGVDDGQRIRVKGHGAAGAGGGPPGDLYVVVHVRKHPIFVRRGAHLTVRVPVTFAEATLGAEIKVPTLEEPVTVRIPSGTPSGKVLRVRGRGIPTGASGRGDLLVSIDVHVPGELTAEERASVEALAAAFTGDPRSALFNGSQSGSSTRAPRQNPAADTDAAASPKKQRSSKSSKSKESRAGQAAAEPSPADQ